MARPSAMEHVKWSTWTMQILLCWSTLLMAASGEELPSTAAVRYWETMLHGGSMPSTIQAMLSPLTSHQATQLLLHTGAYLPTHATSFCKAAHIRCGPNTPNLPASDDPADANLFGYHYRKDATVKAEPVQAHTTSDGPDDAGLFNYHYGKAEPVQARPASDDDDANLFGYHYGKPERVKARPTSDDPADANLFSYHYSKAAPAKAELVQAPPSASNESDDANLFNYHYGKAEPVKARPASDDPDDANLFGYHYRKAATTKAQSVQARPASRDNPDDANLFNYHYGKAEPVQARPASRDNPDDANLFNYHYNKAANAKAEPVQARPASDDPDDANLFSYKGYRYKGVQDGNASPGLQSRISKESGRASRALMSSTIHEIPGVFFREEQVLVSGATIHVNLATYNPSSEKDERAFLPRKLAQLFPLSDEGAEGISRMLGFTREALQNTIDRCNVRNHTDTEVSACLSSVEDIADFVSSTMGSSQPINAYDSLLINATNASFSGKTFLVESVRPLKKDMAEPAVTCHDMSFPFRVFYCHCAPRTMVFRVTLKGEDGTSHERLSVCHYDTSSWNPEHLSFSELNTKPGEAEACHWLGKSWMAQSGWVFSFA